MDPISVTQPNMQKSGSTTDVPARSLTHFSGFTEQFVKTMEGVSKLAEKGPSNLLLSLGTVLIIAALAIKLFGDVSYLHPTEFITIIVAGLAILAGGSYLRFYQYNSYHKLGKDFSDKMLRVAEKTIEIAERTGPGAPGGEPNL